MSHKKLLNESSLFAGIASATLERLAAVAREQNFDKGAEIYKPGDDSTDIYALLSGTVRFTLADRTGVLSSGTILKSRTVFGWAALVPDHPKRIGSAQCADPSTLLVLDGDDVLQVLRDDPESGMMVMERLCAMISRNFLEQRR